ncbi:MAG: hypothetical protein HZA50_09220 [Planctomycetes bacterium]|nr:hypothetical protein [Planctomycetota bacterium]
MKRGIRLFAAAALFALAGLTFAQATNPSQEKPSIKGPWADAKVGAVLKFKVASDSGMAVMTQEVIKADEQSVTIKKTVDKEGEKPGEKVEKKLYTQDELDKKLSFLGKKADDETIKVMGKDVKCEVYTREVKVGSKTLNMKTYVCREVLNWIVRLDDDSSGKMETKVELTEVKN